MDNVALFIDKDHIKSAAVGAAAHIFTAQTRPFFITVMNGAEPWAELVKQSYRDVSGESAYGHRLTASSYKGTVSSGKVHLKVETPAVHAMRSAAKDGDMAVVLEDVIETGKTMEAVVDYLIDLGFPSHRILIISMLHKRDRHTGSYIPGGLFHYTSHSVPAYMAFEMSLKEFVVGFGLDLDGQYRDLDFIGIYIPTTGDSP